MMKAEFEQRIGASISRADYSIVEHVYMWHPSIPNVGGKDKIADLYLIGGMDVIRDMDRRAVELEKKYDDLCAQEKETKGIIEGLHNRIAQIDAEIEQLKSEKSRRIVEHNNLCMRVEEIQKKKKEMI